MKVTEIAKTAREILDLFKRLVETQEKQTKLLEEQIVYSKEHYLMDLNRFDTLIELEKNALLNQKVSHWRDLNMLVRDSVHSLFLHVLPETYDKAVHDLEEFACEVLRVEPDSIKFGRYADMRRLAMLEGIARQRPIEESKAKEEEDK